MKHIKFKVLEGMDLIVINPEPAKKHIPEWYKKMQKEMIKTYTDPINGIQSGMSIKGCPPVLDYLRTGYIIPTYTDITVVESGLSPEQGPKHQIHTSLVDWKTIDHHAPDQTKGSTLGDKNVYKLISPWHIETPVGYSCLFLKPQFSDTKGIDIIPAIVDTDVYHNINFPFTLNITEEGEHFIPKGTPVVHVIPFKRENWKASSPILSDDTFVAHTRRVSSVIKYYYKNLTRGSKRTFM